MKTSRWNRYDKSSELWIPSSKSIYLFWYTYLQHAERDPSRKVDWTKYKGWGGADIVNIKFDIWWRSHWKDLFGYHPDETEPRYKLNTTKPQLDGIKYSLLIYEMRLEHPDEHYWDLAERVAAKEWARRREKGKRDPNFVPEHWSFNIARKVVSRKMAKVDGLGFYEAKRVLSSRIGRYLLKANKHLDNVCKGEFGSPMT